MTSSTWAVFSAFRPEGDTFADAVESAVAEFSNVVVVDDGSGPGFEPVWSRVTTLGAAVIHLEENSGIAAALNRGMLEALGDGCEAVVTFDQDSSFRPGFAASLVETARVALSAGRSAGPVVPQFFADVDQARPGSGNVLDARHAIQSGMLIPRETLESVGMLRDDLFIDLVDTEFALRCILAGRGPVAARGLRLEHALGMRYERRILGIRLPGALTLSTPFRYYYRLRNRLLVNSAYWRRAPLTVVRQSILDAAHFVALFRVARPRRALTSVLRQAWRDGWKGVGGRIPSSAEAAARAVSWKASPLEASDRPTTSEAGR